MAPDNFKNLGLIFKEDQQTTTAQATTTTQKNTS